MKKLSAVLMSLVIALTLSSVVFAKTCPKLVKQIDEKLASMQMSADKVAKIKQMRDQGEQLHKDKKHAESEKILNEALALLAG